MTKGIDKNWYFVHPDDDGTNIPVLLDYENFNLKDRIKGFFKWKLPESYHSTKRKIKKLIKPNHVDNLDIVNFSTKVAKDSILVLTTYLKKLENPEHQWIPAPFVEENAGKYNPDIYVGGGFNRWRQTVEEMLFAMKALIYVNTIAIETSKTVQFYIDYYGESPWEQKSENLKHSYWYWKENPDTGISNWCCSSEKIQEEGYDLRIVETNYINYELIDKARQRMYNGLTLFGKYFCWIW